MKIILIIVLLLLGLSACQSLDKDNDLPQIVVSADDQYQFLRDHLHQNICVIGEVSTPLQNVDFPLERMEKKGGIIKMGYDSIETDISHDTVYLKKIKRGDIMKICGFLQWPPYCEKNCDEQAYVDFYLKNSEIKPLQ